MEYIVKYQFDKDMNKMSKEKYKICFKGLKDNGPYSLFTEKSLYFDYMLKNGCIASIAEYELRKSSIETEVTPKGLRKFVSIYCYEDGLNSEIENDKFVKRYFLHDIEIEKRDAKYIYEEKTKDLMRKESSIQNFFDKETERTVGECFSKETEDLEEER